MRQTRPKTERKKPEQVEPVKPVERQQTEDAAINTEIKTAVLPSTETTEPWGVMIPDPVGMVQGVQPDPTVEEFNKFRLNYAKVCNQLAEAVLNGRVVDKDHIGALNALTDAVIATTPPAYALRG